MPSKFIFPPNYDPIYCEDCGEHEFEAFTTPDEYWDKETQEWKLVANRCKHCKVEILIEQPIDFKSCYKDLMRDHDWKEDSYVNEEGSLINRHKCSKCLTYSASPMI